MKIKTKDLLKTLLPLRGIISENHIVPIYQSVKIDISNGKIKAIGNNLEIECIVTQKIDTKEDIQFCVGYHNFVTILKSLRSSISIDIEIKRKTLYIKHLHGTTKIPFYDPKDFSHTEEVGGSFDIKIESLPFKNALGAAIGYSSSDDIDVVSNVAITTGKNVCILATDKLKLFREFVEGEGKEDVFLINNKACSVLTGLLSEDEKIKIKTDEKRVHFKFSNLDFFVLKREGKYPIESMNRFFDTIKKAKKLELNPKKLSKFLKRVCVLRSKERFSAVKLDFKKKKLVISWSGDFTETSFSETIEVKNKIKELIGYNPNFLITSLELSSEKSDLYITEEGVFCINNDTRTIMIGRLGVSKKK